MSMFCYQCQEAANNSACSVKGVCGKEESTANLQDFLIYALKGLSIYAEKAIEENKFDAKIGSFVAKALFTTITNANFDNEKIESLIRQAYDYRERLKSEFGPDSMLAQHDSVVWFSSDSAALLEKAGQVSILNTENEDIRSLQELLIYGVKGIAAYADHAAVLGYEKAEVYEFLVQALAATLKNKSMEELIALVMKAGEIAVTTMALLDEANTSHFGNPEITEVNLGVRNRPGILISGHDLSDMEMLLEQTKNSGVDIYTHSEMLPAHYYPKFKKYEHFVGNYGNAWWEQDREFKYFNGPILMTTNCITPVKDAYKDRIFTTGNAGYAGVKHINEYAPGKKDFSEIIELAKKSEPPQELETGTIVGGFAHHQVGQLAGKVVDAVKEGVIKRFVVMAGCDGRQKGRSYFTDVAKELPQDTVILTAGCAKYRYNKLNLGDIGGIPRVLDAGQCNDSYSLAVTALKLKEAFQLHDINELPISYDIAWYEQKAVAVLLALLHLGVKGIRLGPTLPAFLSANVAKVLVENFDIKATGEVQADIRAMMAGA